MAVLWYAIGIYMIGVAVVLYTRPRIMFRENGMWKEFGLATEADQTIFPFWMFALVWAILSYAMGNLLSIFFASVALKSMEPVNASFIQPISSHPNMPVTPMAPVQPTMPVQPTGVPNVPGYYILDPYANPAHPRYIYYGLKPPGSE